MPTKAHTRGLHVELLDIDRELLSQAAKLEGRTVGNFVKFHTMRAARQAIQAAKKRVILSSDPVRPTEIKASHGHASDNGPRQV
jgi:uncharacterized protein (DUF1778 family)